MKNTSSDKISMITALSLWRHRTFHAIYVRDGKIELRYCTELVYELNYRYDTNAHGYRYIGIRSKVTNRILCLIIFPALCYNHLGILVHR